MVAMRGTLDRSGGDGQRRWEGPNQRRAGQRGGCGLDQLGTPRVVGVVQLMDHGSYIYLYIYITGWCQIPTEFYFMKRRKKGFQAQKEMKTRKED
jgi:hypothetical protein